MSSMTFYISNLLEKMTSTDKDFRFMAANDLMMELQKDSIKLDEESERKIVAMLLKLLEDKNGEVQNLAVKCLGPLVGKVKQGQVDTMVDTLCSNMVSDKEQLRDISSMGLKTVIAELPLSATDSGLTVGTCRRIISQLIGAVGMQDDVSIQLEALDIISEMLGRLSNALGSFHQSILSSLLAQLTNPRMAVRKRSIIALGHLVPSCGPDLFDQLIQHLGEELTRGPPTANIRTCIQCLATVSRAGEYRIGIYLDKLVPMVVTFCNMEDDELREFCFQAFEAFVSRCPKEMSPHISTVTALCLQYIAYDPNYNYDADDEDNMDLEEGEDEEQESDDEYSDDDDMSWKVRHSSVKCLEAIILSRGDLLVELYGSIAPTLVSRFKEREENVKTVIFSAFVALLKQTRRPPGSSYDSQPREEAAASLLKNMIPAIIKSLQRHLKDRSMKCRQSCFSLLTELTTVLPGNLQEHVSALIPGVIYSLTDKSTSSNMKINALSFLYVFLRSHSPEILPPYINIILPAVIQCVQDPFYKITSEALHVTQQMVKMMRPLDRPMAFDAQPYVKSVFSCTLARLKATDIDQEVKERAIICMGHILNHLGDHLGDDLQVTLQIFLERLRNEITRLVTVKTLILVASSPLQIDLSPILSEAIPTLASYLRKTQRALKLTTLAALKLMVKTYSGSFKPPVMESVMCEVPALIQESDMHVSQEAITLLTCMLEVSPAFLSQVKETILPKLFKLVYSPLLQGGALTSILQLLKVLVTAPGSGLTCGDLLKAIKSPFTDTKADSVHRQSYFSVAKCVAALIAACPREVSGMVTNLILDVKSPKTPEAVRILSLLCLGEIGRVTSFKEQKDLRGIIMEVFNSPNEEVKSAASFALANISIGNLEEYLPFLLKEITAQPKKQYLLLHSLKEALSALSAQRLKPHVENIWTLLFQHCECAEEGTRGIVAECLGKLTLVNPSEFLPRLKTQLSSGSPLLRSTVVTAVKFTIVDQPVPIDSLLNECIGDFLKTLQDPDPNVRRVTLVMFNSAAHNKPFLIRRLLTSLLPHLYAETRIRKELIREVEMGPFKHTVDDGLDVRKAAFECMYTLLDNCLDCVDVFEFLNYVEEGLKDHYDIKMLTFIMLARLSKLCPAAVVQRLDRLIEPLKATCSTKVKTGSVKQEFEKQEELRRSALRAIAALLSISEVQKSPAMADFTNQIRSNSEMATIFDSLQEEPLTEKMESMDTS